MLSLRRVLVTLHKWFTIINEQDKYNRRHRIQYLVYTNIVQLGRLYIKV
jgi:hypothetical protein